MRFLIAISLLALCSWANAQTANFEYENQARAACKAEWGGADGSPHQDNDGEGGTPDRYLAFHECAFYPPYSYRGFCGENQDGTVYGYDQCAPNANYGTENLHRWFTFNNAGDNCDEIGGHSSFHTQLEPPATCVDGCEFEATTGTCSDDGSGGFWCSFIMDPTGDSCDEPPPQGEDFPENCAVNEFTQAVVCDCTGGNATQYPCYEDEGPSPEPPDVPPNCIELNDVLLCDDWPAEPVPPDPDDIPDHCRVSGSVMYCPPGEDNPDPDSPIDTGDPAQPGTGPGDDGPPGPGDPDGESPGCEGEDCDTTNGEATTSGSCETPPTCTGDALQCASILQSWKNVCGVLDVQGNKPPWEDDPDWGRDLKSEATQMDVSTTIDHGGMGGGSCPPNITIPLMGETIEIDMLPACDLAGVIRIFVLIFAYIGALYIVSRAF